MSRWCDGFPQCPNCKMPLALCLCGQGREILAKRAEELNNLAEIGRALWKRLFLEVFTEEDLCKWEADVPNYDCKCGDFYISWKLENPVVFPIDMDWKYRLKSAVNAKLGKPNISFEEAVRIWSV